MFVSPLDEGGFSGRTTLRTGIPICQRFERLCDRNFAEEVSTGHRGHARLLSVGGHREFLQSDGTRILFGMDCKLQEFFYNEGTES